MQPLDPSFKRCQRVWKNVSIELFAEGSLEEAAEPPLHVKGGSARVNLPSYMIEVKRKI